MSDYTIVQQFFATVRGTRREILRTVRCDDWPCCGPFVGKPAPTPAPIPPTPIMIDHIVNGTNDIYNNTNLIIN